ncbi:MAG: glycosyltransferase [Bradymonadia bacterium]
MRRVLMMTAAWPPVARVGARRPLRLARRLPALGWQPIVLTPEPNSIFRKMPNLDETLSVPDVEVLRVPALIPSTRLARLLSRLPGPVGTNAQRLLAALLKPDQYPEWTRAARKAAKRIEGIDCVWVTGGPFGMFCVGAAVAKQLDVPLVLDYRDPWTVDLKRKKLAVGRSRKAIKKLEADLLRRAAAVSYVNTNMLARNVAAFSPGPDAHWAVIPNGFDSTDVQFETPVDHGVRTLLYAGACYGSRSMLPILEALKAVDDSLPPLKLKIFGELDPSATQFLRKHPMPERIEVNGRVGATEIAPLMAGADALLLIIGNEHKTALSAKVFDYLEVRRPIIGFGPAGADAGQLIEQCSVGLWADSREQLASAFRQLAQGPVEYEPKTEQLHRYSADMMAERTADLLNRVVGEPNRVQD